MNVSLMKPTETEKNEMIQFATSKTFNVRCTQFPHTNTHTHTHTHTHIYIYIFKKRHGTQQTVGQRIKDKVLISTRFKSAVRDIRALRGPDILSNHSLLKINFPVKVRAKTETRVCYRT